VLFVSRLHGVRGHPRWPAEPRATQGALALTGSLPDERSLDLRRAPRRNRSDRPPNRSDQISRRRCKERRCVLHFQVRSCVGPESASTIIYLYFHFFPTHSCLRPAPATRFPIPDGEFAAGVAADGALGARPLEGGRDATVGRISWQRSTPGRLSPAWRRISSRLSIALRSSSRRRGCWWVAQPTFAHGHLSIRWIVPRLVLDDDDSYGGGG